MATTNTHKIDPLNGDNYIAWRRCLKWILDDLELWELTNSAEAEPKPADPRAVTSAERTAVNEWKKKDKKTKKEI